jgi:transmembrane sensor
MSDRMWRALGEKIEPDWGPDRLRAVRLAVLAKARKGRARARVTGAFVLVGASALSGLGVWLLRPSAPPDVTRAVRTTPSHEKPAERGRPADDDGAPIVETVTVTRLSTETIVEPLPGRGGRGFALRAGGARFDVPHDDNRPFVVTAGNVTIEDLGTTFTVRHVPGRVVSVSVEHGRVRVRAPNTDTEIAEGEKLEVPVSPAPSPSTDGSRASQAKARPGSRAAASSWRPFAERGEYEQARQALQKAGPGAVRDDAAELLLAADAARLSGYPAEAVPYLERLLRRHADDPRAGLAAFTLGRVLLDELGRPREASTAFARARAFGGPLAEDALAREVEAAARAGDAARKRELALLYRSLYPNGRRAKAVSRFGGLD